MCVYFQGLDSSAASTPGQSGKKRKRNKKNRNKNKAD